MAKTCLVFLAEGFEEIETVNPHPILTLHVTPTPQSHQRAWGVGCRAKEVGDCRRGSAAQPAVWRSTQVTPVDIFRRAGMEVTVASLDAETAVKVCPILRIPPPTGLLNMRTPS